MGWTSVTLTGTTSGNPATLAEAIITGAPYGRTSYVVHVVPVTEPATGDKVTFTDRVGNPNAVPPQSYAGTGTDIGPEIDLVQWNSGKASTPIWLKYENGLNAKGVLNTGTSLIVVIWTDPPAVI